jgi:uncharacterized protein YijF (DUF1287 family)
MDRYSKAHSSTLLSWHSSLAQIVQDMMAYNYAQRTKKLLLRSISHSVSRYRPPVLNKACYFIRQQSTITTKEWDALEDMTGGNMRNQMILHQVSS